MKRYADDLTQLLLHTILFLFLLQLLTSFVAAIYAFGLLGTSIPPEIAAVLLLFSPALLLLRRRRPGRIALLIPPLVMVAARVGGVMLDTRGRMLVTGVGTAASLLWLVLTLWHMGQRDRAQDAGRLSLSLLAALLLSMLLRAAGSGSDISLGGATQFIGWVLAAGALLLLWRTSGAVPPAEKGQSGATIRLVGMAIGTTSVLLLLYFVFSAPHVLSRWTGGNYPAIVATTAAALLLFCAVVAIRPSWLPVPGRAALWGANGLFVMALVATILTHQLRFPATVASYPLYAPAGSALQSVPLFLTLLLCPILFWDFALFAGDIARMRPTARELGLAFGVASLFLVVLVFAHVFTTVYDYIPVVGPLFRDRFWLVHLLAGLGVLLPLFAIRDITFAWRPPSLVPAGAALIALLAITAALTTAARPPAAPPVAQLRVLTYNIQQGYSESGSLNFDGQLDLIRRLDPDIIGLQESDTARIAGGNDDVVRYFADRLEMYSYYGPKTVPGTFGIALLSKYPIENPRTFYMYSEGEQTATIEAEIDAGFGPLHLFVTHLGNSGPQVQQEAILEVVDGLESVVLIGDFNFRPETEQYRLTTAVLEDAWIRTGSPAPEPANRIDHIFVSENVHVAEMRYILDPASDHPAALAVVSLR